MVANFQQIDSVFGGDGPLCAVNLKKLWCEYGCNSRSYTFIRGTGYLMQDLNGIMTNFTKVVFTMDDEMACTMFKSCNKVSMIA